MSALLNHLQSIARLSERSAVFPAVRIVSSKKEKLVYTDAVITLSQRPNPLCTAFRLKLPYGVDYHLHLGHHLEYDNGKSVRRTAFRRSNDR